jgi:hypothetical protein
LPERIASFLLYRQRVLLSRFLTINPKYALCHVPHQARADRVRVAVSNSFGFERKKANSPLNLLAQALQFKNIEVAVWEDSPSKGH